MRPLCSGIASTAERSIVLWRDLEPAAGRKCRPETRQNARSGTRTDGQQALSRNGRSSVGRLCKSKGVRVARPRQRGQCGDSHKDCRCSEGPLASISVVATLRPADVLRYGRLGGPKAASGGPSVAPARWSRQSG